MQKELVRKYASPVPRYTSYPTAPHFHAGVTQEKHRVWLAGIGGEERISLYVHIPFCDTLCWFCGCHTKQVRRYEPIADYLVALEAEVATVAEALSAHPAVTHLHFGGGSPTILVPDDLRRFVAALTRHFRFASRPEISVEIDPRDISEEKLDALADIGLTRASIGVQDFSSKVQAAINRFQSFEQTRDVVEGLRRRGVRSINVDMVYGLPHQTREMLRQTVDQVIELRPDRVALFGYAHVPWMKKHQTMIDEAALPNVVERYAGASRAASRLTAAGYVRIGIDHFALPEDGLAVAQGEGRLRRNFQGYTDDPAQALVGLGASSISELPQGYVQNITATPVYMKRVLAGELATARGYELTREDRMRRAFIEKLMCEFAVDRTTFREAYGDLAGPLLQDAEDLAAADNDGLVEMEGDLFRVTPRGRAFVRTIAASFDAYLQEGGARHSVAV